MPQINQPTYPQTHSDSISKLNEIMIAIKLHLSSARPITSIDHLDKLANEIRADIEKCKDKENLVF